MIEEKPKEDLKLIRIERLPNGEKVLCVRGRHHGKKIVEKLTLEEVEKMFKEC